jgi:hypothetical protein
MNSHSGKVPAIIDIFFFLFNSSLKLATNADLSKKANFYVALLTDPVISLIK